MSFQIVRGAETRETVTPSAVMTTLASPTVGGTSRLSLWQVALEAGAAGPVHIIDSEQVWTLLRGNVRCTIEGSAQVLLPGDTIRLAGGVERQFVASESSRFMVCGECGAKAWVANGAPAVTPPWIA